MACITFLWSLDMAKTLKRPHSPVAPANPEKSPFTFYRGSAGVMAADLAPTPAMGIHVQACGDAHLLNFGGSLVQG